MENIGNLWKYLTSMDFFFEHIYGNLWKIYGKHGKSMENLWTICDIYGKYGTSMVDFFWKTWEIFGKHRISMENMQHLWNIFGKHGKSMEHLWKIQRSMENMRKLY